MENLINICFKFY